jgi:cobalamin biosynthetic protein CobC
MMSRPLKAVFHGGDLDTARARFPDAVEPWIDLSTGINPHPYPLPSLSNSVWTALPQASAEAQLRRSAAAAYGAASVDMIAAAPGSQALIQIVPRLVERARVAIIAPTYAEHAASWRREGHDVVEIDDLDAIGNARVVVVTNPNNPTGRILSKPALCAVAEALRVRGGLLVVDEAFADVMPENTSIVPDLPSSAVVLRSFGKTYGLGGVRLGFAIAEPAVTARVRDMLGPWAVSGPAMAIGTAALSDTPWLEHTKQRLQASSARLDALLSSSGFAVVGGSPLFRLAVHPAAPAIVEGLGRCAIHVRRFPEQPTWLRFGLPGDERHWRRLERALTAAHRDHQAEHWTTP